jgi:gluconokinase
MGVAGSGKSTVMAELSRLLGWRSLEGDDLHSPANRARMAAGIPLTDADRAPWLAAVHAWLGEAAARGEPVLATCSALRRRYRDILREDLPGLVFVHLDAPRELLEARLRERTGHFVRATLLDSQLATLEPLAAADGERGFVVDALGAPGDIAAEIVARLGRALAPDRGSG